MSLPCAIAKAFSAIGLRRSPYLDGEREFIVDSFGGITPYFLGRVFEVWGLSEFLVKGVGLAIYI